MLKEREQWKSRLGFILAATGSAVGLGNVWRFPFVAGEQGGAAFLVIYLIAVAFIGYPLMVTEISIGRKTQRNPIGAFKALAPNTPWWIVGGVSVLAGFIILSYYSVIAGWSLAFIIESIAGFPEGIEATDQLFGGHKTGIAKPIFYHALFMVIVIGVISAGVVKGIQRVVQWLMPILVVLLLMVVVRSVTLPGASEGIAFLFRPDFSAVSWDTILSAVGQSFFTLSLGMGAIITYGSYLSAKENIPSSSVQVIGADTLIAIISGLAIFPAVFALGFAPDEGAGLVFVTLPAVFAEMPFGGGVGFLFFVLLSIAALTSAISLLEVVVSYFVDEKDWPRKKAAASIGIAAFFVGLLPVLGYSALDHIKFLGMDILDTYDFFADSIMLPLGGALTAAFAGHVWSTKSLMEEANKESKSFRIGSWVGPFLKYIIPIGIIIVMIAGIIEVL
ncbi:sodium-dependent transporter [Proteinivorax hydrogeniformans]|uniref:Sodium-dependent transporter n=1 Tax=Proteinivorax hydrogeniformans TaxID=1826727 RepID=A0AAU8HVS1_9FIRM